MKVVKREKLTSLLGSTDWSALNGLDDRDIERVAAVDPDARLLNSCDLAQLKRTVDPRHARGRSVPRPKGR